MCTLQHLVLINMYGVLIFPPAIIKERSPTTANQHFKAKPAQIC